MTDILELKTTFGVRWVEPTRPEVPQGPRYNISPRQWLPVVIHSSKGRAVERSETSTEGGHELRWMRWGIVPPWTPPEEVLRFDGRTINARSETAAEKPTFKRPLALRRCLVPASSYYEWETRMEPGSTEEAPSGPAQLGLFGDSSGANAVSGSTGRRPKAPRPVKIPHRISAAEGGLLVLAGIYEVWGAGTPQALPTVSLFTRPANTFTSRIHDRMPILLRREDWDRWLDPQVRSLEAASTLLHELAEKEPSPLQEYVVSSRVNSPGQDDPSLWEPA